MHALESGIATYMDHCISLVKKISAASVTAAKGVWPTRSQCIARNDHCATCGTILCSVFNRIWAAMLSTAWAGQNMGSHCSAGWWVGYLSMHHSSSSSSSSSSFNKSTSLHGSKQRSWICNEYIWFGKKANASAQQRLTPRPRRDPCHAHQNHRHTHSTIRLFTNIIQTVQMRLKKRCDVMWVHRLIDVHVILRPFYSLKKKDTSQNSVHVSNRLNIFLDAKKSHRRPYTMHNSHQYTNQNVTIVFDLCKPIDDANKRRNVRRLIDVHAILRRFYSLKKRIRLRIACTWAIVSTCFSMQRNLNGDPSPCTIHISIQFNQAIHIWFMQSVDDTKQTKSCSPSYWRAHYSETFYSLRKKVRLRITIVSE